LAERLEVPLELDRAEFRADRVGRTFALEVFPALSARASEAGPSVAIPAPVRRQIDRWRRDVFTEAGLVYDARFQDIAKPVRLRGYFQCVRYFHNLDARALFALPGTSERLSGIRDAVGGEWFAMHIRRGDYLKSETAAYHGLCSDEYFERALVLVRELHGRDLPVVIFTDQPDAVSVRLSERAALIVGPDPSMHEAEDLWAMSHASGLVMSNSSFSWWAGYLQDRPGRPVVGPRPWLRFQDHAASDLLLPQWLTLGAQA
jgi:hypothetical protein